MTAAVTNYQKIATIQDVDPDELLMCPYDPVHRVAAKRFPYHLMKCKKNFPTVILEPCPFNARHLVKKHEYRHHLCTCPDKVMLEQDVLHHQAKETGDEGAFFKGNTDVPPYHNPDFKMPSPTENWDIDSDESSHELENRQPNSWNGSGDFMTPSERRKHHEKLKREALRRARGKPAVPEEGDPDYEEYMRSERQRKREVNEKPVRRPRNPPAVLQHSLSQPDYGPPRIAANIYGAETNTQPLAASSTALVPTDRMFKQAALNIASFYSQTGDSNSSSVLGHVAKATATSAYLEEMGKRSAIPISVSVPTARPANGLLAIAQTLDSQTDTSSCAPTMRGVTPNFVPSGGKMSSGVVANTSGISPFQKAPAGLGRGRGRGIMDLLTLKKSGGGMNDSQGPQRKKAAMDGNGHPEWPSLAKAMKGSALPSENGDNSVLLSQARNDSNTPSGNAASTENNPPLPPGVVSDAKASSATDQTQETIEAKKKKKIRKLNKKLREIIILQEKQKKGDTLNEEEMKKVNKKDHLVEKLAAVTLE
ncbi:uncharacterized protein [Ptychodera flava]|uniref:uncharacterized protein isoform X2 n=1 Tax=Ptychodera flava TaxID=63121 RepID=UPI00396A3BB7